MSGNRFDISSKLKGMKFMQRGEEARKQQKEQQQTPRPSEAAADQPSAAPDISLSSQQTPAAGAAAAAGGTPHSGSGSKFSGKLLQMKFMQRAAERTKLEQGVQKQDERNKEVGLRWWRGGVG